MNGTSILVYAAWSTARMKHPQTGKTLYYRAFHSARRCCCISCERAVESLIFISTFKKSEVDSGSLRSVKSTVHACRVVFFSLLLARARVCVFFLYISLYQFSLYPCIIIPVSIVVVIVAVKNEKVFR